MSHTEFLSGELLQFNYLGKIYKARVIAKEHGDYRIELLTTNHPFGSGRWDGTHLISSHYGLQRASPPLDQKQTVSLKMKLLWNNSNYVKLNPERAY